jgi:hypothetical protein
MSSPTRSRTSGPANAAPVVEYLAQSGRLLRRDVTGSGEQTAVGITRAFRAVLDMENLDDLSNIADAHGLLLTAPESPPKATLEPAVRAKAALVPELGGAVVDIVSTAEGFLRGLRQLQSAYRLGVIDNPGKLPEVVLKDTLCWVEGEYRKRTWYYEPLFAITAWVPRPVALDSLPT